MAWLTGWNYRKAHTINGSTAGAQTNYQIRIKVHRTTGTDSGEDVYVGTKCRADFGDIRFTKSDGTTPLDYWLESYDGGVATFWVKVPSIPASPNTTTIYVYYGNSSASTTSNGFNTFPVFDDFDTGYNIGDSPKSERGWSVLNKTTGDICEIATAPTGRTGKVLRYKEGGTGGSVLILQLDFSQMLNCAIGFYMYWATRSYQWRIDIMDKDDQASYISSRSRRPDKWYQQWYNGSEFRNYSPSWVHPEDTWNKLEFICESNDHDLITDGTLRSGGVRASGDGYDRVWIYGHDDYTDDFYIDDFYIRKYVDPEPSHGTWGSEEAIPPAPTNVQATDGTYSDKVRITWTKSAGATSYQVYRDGVGLGWLGDVDSYDDTGADPPAITAGSTVASDGTYSDKVHLSLSGTGTNNGTTHTYKVRAKNEVGESPDSNTDTGYRAPGPLSYQWQRSAGDSNANYSNISGATASTYDDTGAPAPTITPGSTVASDGTHTGYVALSLSGTATSNGEGRYYRCYLTAAGCTPKYSAPDRGYRSPGTLSYQWQRSAGDSDASYSNISGATSSTYNDNGAPAPTITAGTASASDGTHTGYVALTVSGASANVGAGRYYRCYLTAAGCTPKYSSPDRGYRGVGTLTYQWYRSAGDSDANFSAISGATSASYNDSSAPAPTITPGTASASDGTYTDKVVLSISGQSANPGAGRYYYCHLTATGASPKDTNHDRGYRGVGSLSYQWYRSGADSDSNYSALSGATSASHNDTTAPAPTITAGTATATDGTYTDKVVLSLSGQSSNPGAGRYYYCHLTAQGASPVNTNHDRGYRGAGSLSYQWYRSSADSDSNYSAISGATSASYNDTAAPAPTITPGTANASDGTYTDKVVLNISGESANVGEGRYYYCHLTAPDASPKDTNHDRGYRGVGSLSYQWYRSSADSDSNFSAISGATTATYNDSSAPAPTITPGSAVASDGTYTDHVALSLSGTSVNNGEGRYYFCRLAASGASSKDTNHDRGYRGHGPLNYQWQRSSGDSDANYSNIAGATSATYNDSAAPSPSVSPGTASASDGSYTGYVLLSLTGESANPGAGRFYRCVLNASGCTQQVSAPDRGYRGVGSLNYQWYRSSGDSDDDYSPIDGATGKSYNDTEAPAPTITHGSVTASKGTYTDKVVLTNTGASANTGAGRYYKCLVSAEGAASQYSTVDRGYRGVGVLTYQWYRSAADSDANYSILSGATSSTFNDTGAPAPTITPGTASASDGTSALHVSLSLSGQSANVGAGRYYKCYHTAEGAAPGFTGSDRGYRGVGPLNYQWQRSTADSDANYSDISGATTPTYNDTGAPAYTVNPPTSVSAEGISTSVIRVYWFGASVTEGEGRYYRCRLTADGASTQYSSSDRGYRDDSIATTNGYEIFSDTIPTGTYSTSEGLDSASPFDDTGLPENTTKYYKVRAKSTAGTWSPLSSVYGTGTTWSTLSKILSSIFNLRNIIPRILAFASYVFSLVSNQSVVKYAANSLVSKATTIVFVLKNLVGQATPLMYMTLNLASRILDGTWSIIGKIRRTLRTVWNNLQLRFQEIILTYQDLILIANSVLARFNIRSLVSGASILAYGLKEIASRAISEVWDTLKLAVRTTSTKYNVRRIVAKSVNILYSLISLVSRTLSIIYYSRTLLSKAFILIYPLKSLASRSISISYSVFNLARRSISILWRVAERVVRTTVLNFKLKNIIAGSLDLIYSLKALASKILTSLYNLTNLVSKITGFLYCLTIPVSKMMLLLYNIRSIVSKAVASKFNIRNLVPALFSIILNIRNLVTGSTVLKFGLKSLVARTLDILHSIINVVSRSMNVVYGLLNLVYKELDLRFKIRNLVQRTTIVCYALISRVVGLLSIQFILKILKSKFFSFRYSSRELLERGFTFKYHLLSLLQKTLGLLHSLLGKIYTSFSASYHTFILVSISLLSKFNIGFIIKKIVTLALKPYQLSLRLKGYDLTLTLKKLEEITKLKYSLTLVLKKVKKTIGTLVKRG